MKSNVCKIEKGSKDLDAILKESEKVAIYNGLNQKQTLQLRLLCEEMDGMLPNIIDDFSGDIWFEFENGICKVNVSIQFDEFSFDKKERLIGIAKNKKNAAAIGIVGKIRSVIEDFFLDGKSLQPYVVSSGLFNLATGYSEGVDYSYLWSLGQYKNTVKQEQAEDWDELEKSIIASLADDVIVGVKGKQANIVIVKNFN